MIFLTRNVLVAFPITAPYAGSGTAEYSASVQGGFLLSLDLLEDDRFYDDKADVLEMNGLGESSSFILRPNTEPPEQLLGFLRLLNLQGLQPYSKTCAHACYQA